MYAVKVPRLPLQAVGGFDNLIFYQRLTMFIHLVEVTDGKGFETARYASNMWQKKHTQIG
jgi:hypothetical protein